MKACTPGAGLLRAATGRRVVAAATRIARRLGQTAALALAIGLATPSAAKATVDAGGAAATPVIRIAPGGWGSTQVEDLQEVLDAVAAVFGSRFPGRPLGAIRVVPGAAPLVLFERDAAGAYVVELSARNARWFQFVYQFAHELCHIYSNFDNKDQGPEGRGNQWFEETVCETAALYTLRTLAESWSNRPPDDRWRPHAAALRNYADYFLNEPHRRLPSTHAFPAWFRENQTALFSNPYVRSKNEVVANLLLPLFEHDPRSWGAIGYLNYERTHARKGFADFLHAWHDACPEEYRPVVSEIMALFESAPTQTAAVPASPELPRP